MTTLCSDLINDGYLFAGIGDQYNPQDNESTQKALRFLNDLTSSFSADVLKIYNVTEALLPLVSGQQTYTIGNGQAVTYYPPEITDVNIKDQGGITHPVKLISVGEWSSFTFLGAPGRPEYCWANMNADTWTLNLWPTESFANDTLHIFGGTIISQFTALSNVFTAPAGYSLFFKAALGKVLAAISKKPFTQEQKDVLFEAQKVIQARNSPRRIMRTDVPQDTTGGGGWFNIFTGYPN